MAIFRAIGKLMVLIKNMTKAKNEKTIQDDKTYSVPEDDPNSSASKTDSGTCPNASNNQSSSAASTNQPVNTQDEVGDCEEGDDMGIGDLLPSINLNVDDPNDEEQDPPKTFLEWLFGFILDPLTAIIKGIINTVELVLITINVATNLKRCAKWFFIYVFCTLVYLPISMLFSLLNLSKFEKKIWNILNGVDAAIFCILEKVRGTGKGFHIIRFNDDIREICFLEDVKPTDCNPPPSKTTKKCKKKIDKTKLSSYLFLLVTIFFMCFFIFRFGRYGMTIGKEGSPLFFTNELPFTFSLLFFMIVFVTVYMIVTTFVDAFIYIFIVAVIPIALFLFSSIFHLFTMAYDTDYMGSPTTFPRRIKPIIDFLSAYSIGIIGIFIHLPKIYQYIVGFISVIVMFIIIMIIVFLVLPLEYSTVATTNPTVLFFSFLNISDYVQKFGYQVNMSIGRIPSTPITTTTNKNN
jgi:hypothetical protein